MIEVALKLQPEGEPREIDGLFWGDEEPVQFRGMSEEGDRLFGENGIYLFRPVCRKDANKACDVWRNGRSQFPDSDPVEIRRIDDWCDPNTLKAIVDKAKTLDRVGINKDKGESPMPLSDFNEGLLREQDSRIQAAEDWLAKDHDPSDNPEYFWLYYSLSSALPNWPIDEMLKSIRYAVSYQNHEVLYLSNLEKKSLPITKAKDSEIDADDGTRFELLNDYRTIKDKKAGVLYSLKPGCTAHRALKAFHLHTSPEDRLGAWEIIEHMEGSEGIEPRPKKWFKHGITRDDGERTFLRDAFDGLFKSNSTGLWWIDLNDSSG